jgi:hypothetical protein
MSNQPHAIARFPLARKFWKPAAVTGAGGTTLLLWFEEVIAFATEFIGVILLTVLGGLICIYNNFVLKSRIPKREDLQDTLNKRKERVPDDATK